MTIDEALAELLRLLRVHGYQFTTVTPATHAIVLERGFSKPPDIRGIFGWNRSFRAGDLDSEILAAMQRANAVQTLPGGELRSRVRVASLNSDLFLHSAFPTREADSVFFGPDTYRFVRFVERSLTRCEKVRHVVDMGAGAGAGGIAVARRCPSAQVTLVDLNRCALSFARTNAEAARVAVNLVEGSRVPAGADLIIANPPYMIDPLARTYRHGGQLFGGSVSLDWVRQALATIAPGATILLYTGAAYVEGSAPLLDALKQECANAAVDMEIEEIDPDVFGAELNDTAYAAVERIAAIGVVITS